MQIEISKLIPEESDGFSALLKIFEGVFEWNNFSLPQKTHLKKLLNNPNFLVFVAMADKKLAGGLTAYVLDKYDTEKPAAYLYDIAVLPGYQRNGIGKLLIAGLNDYCKQHGFSEVFVQAEADDIKAVNFYKTTPISSELEVKHFTYSFTNNVTYEQ
jgi:aminoglycoside 3-N-acetyltransferase I